jgi:8-oxo-dGTP diphosphatase
MGAVLHVYLAHIEAGAPTPGHDHMSVRWVTPAEFATIDWLDSDREALPAVVRALAQTP